MLGDSMELKELLKEARKQTGMTQKQFAEYFRIPYRTLEDWERGDRVQIKKKLKLYIVSILLMCTELLDIERY